MPDVYSTETGTDVSNLTWYAASGSTNGHFQAYNWPAGAYMDFSRQNMLVIRATNVTAAQSFALVSPSANSTNSFGVTMYCSLLNIAGFGLSSLNQVEFGCFSSQTPTSTMRGIVAGYQGQTTLDVGVHQFISSNMTQNASLWNFPSDVTFGPRAPVVTPFVLDFRVTAGATTNCTVKYDFAPGFSAPMLKTFAINPTFTYSTLLPAYYGILFYASISQYPEYQFGIYGVQYHD